MFMDRIKKILTYALLAVILGYMIGVASRIFEADSRQDKLAAKLAEVQSIIDSRFIGEADPDALIDGAAAGMVAAINDRWSYYMSAEEYEAYLEVMANAYVGVGITIQPDEEGFLQVMQVEKDGGADTAGILPGDVIVAVEGQDAAQLGTAGARDIIRGEEGTFVTVTVRRDGIDQNVTVERKYIQTAVASAQMLDGQVGLVTIVNFDERCFEESVAAIETLRAQGAKSLIFDVRNNPGGYKNELVKLLDHLLPEGVLFRSEHYNGKVEEDTSDPNFLDMPMAVLINANSYSAAEFFAAALYEYDAAVLVGEKTTGKGHFQNTFRLSDGSAVNISTGRYTTPKGVSLADVGLTPDITVTVDADTAAAIYSRKLPAEDDPQIQAAVKELAN